MSDQITTAVLVIWMFFATFVFFSPYLGVAIPMPVATAVYALMLVGGIVRVLLMWLRSRSGTIKQS
ncbi:MAG: hypothetical protein ACKO14_06440 [Armatimonadota bacterium]